MVPKPISEIKGEPSQGQIECAFGSEIMSECDFLVPIREGKGDSLASRSILPSGRL